jgi:hypothetical protein
MHSLGDIHIYLLTYITVRIVFQLTTSVGRDQGIICYTVTQEYHVRWVPCHHSMARPQVADGGNTLQVWRVAANTLNKQSRTDKRPKQKKMDMRFGT